MLKKRTEVDPIEKVFALGSVVEFAMTTVSPEVAEHSANLRFGQFFLFFSCVHFCGASDWLLGQSLVHTRYKRKVSP